MKLMKQGFIVGLLVSLFVVSNVEAKEPVDADMVFSQSIDKAIDMLEKSTYKTIEVSTIGGTFYGEFVSKSKETLVLKSVTDNTHLDSGKTRVGLVFIRLDSIVAISVSVLE